MEGRVFGYARVSSESQHEDRQLDALRNFGVDDRMIYVDKQSGKNFDRPRYKKMVKRMRKGDLLVLGSIDRLGRNYKQMLEQWQILTKKKYVDIFVLDMPILDTRKDRDLSGTLIADIVLQLLCYVSETERSHIKARQAEGILAAKNRGVKFGRPEKELPSNFTEICNMWGRGELTINEAAVKCGMSRTTFYNKARRYKTA